MVKKFLIGIAGAHSTGKTSFCDDIQLRLNKMGITVSRVPSFGRLAVECGIPILKEHTYSSTKWFIDKTIAAQEIEYNKESVVLVDRPIIDAIAYWMAAVEYRKSPLIFNEYNELTKIILNKNHLYSHIFATRINPLIPVDSNRDNDVVFRNRVEHHLHETLQKNNIVYTELTHSNRQEMISNLCSEIAIEVGL
jgi:thymidylate kinase